MKAIILGSVIVAGIYAILLAAWFRACNRDACPSAENLTVLPLRQTSTIYASDGSMIAEVGTERRAFIPLGEMAPVLKAAFLVTEDRRFYRHHGVDYLRVLGAIGANLTHGRMRQGFSTITMQLARNLWPETIDGRQRTLGRKVREIQVAYKIEKKLGKDRILELYLNQIPLGGQVFGVELGPPGNTSASPPHRSMWPRRRSWPDFPRDRPPIIHAVFPNGRSLGET